jgi:hypothetical protein
MRHVPKRPADSQAASIAAAHYAALVGPFDDDQLAGAERLLYGPDLEASLVAAAALGRSGRSRALVCLVDTVFYADPDAPEVASRVRRAAIDALAELDPDDDFAIGAFIAASRDPQRDVAERAIAALSRCRIQRGRAARALGPFLHDRDPCRRGAAGRALLSLGTWAMV